MIKAMRVNMQMMVFCSGLTLFAAVVFPAVSRGQIAVGLSMPESKVVHYESVKAVVTIGNNSGQFISFGSDASSARLLFEIEKVNEFIVKRRNAKPLISNLSIISGETRTAEIELLQYYPMLDIGLYIVKAVVKWNSVDYASSGIYIEVARGFELAKIKAGIPSDKDAARTYVLEYLQMKIGENLYLRIRDDRRNVIYGMFNLGRIVRVRKPVLKIDESGNVHVLFQTIGMGYIHTAYTPYGVWLFSENIDSGKYIVSLEELPNGRITVMKEIIPRESEPSVLPIAGKP